VAQLANPPLSTGGRESSGEPFTEGVGVSQLKIDPYLLLPINTPASTADAATAVTSEDYLSYSQDLTQSNSQLIRVEWGRFTPRFSACPPREKKRIVGWTSSIESSFH